MERSTAHGSTRWSATTGEDASASGLQQLLSLPFELRFPVARDPDLLGDLCRIFVRSCFALQRRQARRQGIEDARPAAVVSVQRFDSALPLNPHFHALFVDGVFTVSSGADRVVFYPLPPPSDAVVGATHTLPGKNGVARIYGIRGNSSGGVEQLFGLAIGLRTR